MDTTLRPQGPNRVTSVQRRVLRRFRSSPTWWLAMGGGLAVLGACSAGSTSSQTPVSPPSSPAQPSSPVDAGSSTTAPPTSSPTPSSDSGADAGPPGFSYSVFETAIQPILDTAGTTGCTNTSCHGSASGQGGLILARQPAAGSPGMQANFQAITALCNTAVPDQSLFYTQATNNHGGISVSQAQASTILSWIQHASGTTTAPTSGGADGGGTPPGCVPASSFNLGLFAAEIEPILFGTLDYNVAPGQPVANNGCARATCHGATTNPLNISTTNTPIQNLTNFACFVNLANPSASAILQCPLNYPGCPKSPHPGQDVFASEEDLNYQRIASWLYATQGAASPLDFAFFARQVAPIFDDPNSGGLQSGARTCSDTISCHGVSAAGQVPPNLSNFPILADGVTPQGFQVNYWSAASFANFFTATGSELFLYPTNLIANTVNQPYATGLAHPGGVDFSPTSTQATAILTWAGGLQLDNNGDLLNWLVAGTYDATLVTQTTGAGDDSTLAPTIFDQSSGSESGGIWDLDSSASEFIDSERGARRQRRDRPSRLRGGQRHQRNRQRHSRRADQHHLAQRGAPRNRHGVHGAVHPGFRGRKQLREPQRDAPGVLHRQDEHPHPHKGAQPAGRRQVRLHVQSRGAEQPTIPKRRTDFPPRSDRRYLK